jgi:hypothetical protein
VTTRTDSLIDEMDSSHNLTGIEVPKL